MSRVSWHLVLALAMLLMQQAGLRHSLKHALNDEGVATHAACIECLAHHAHDHGTAHTLPPLLLAHFSHVATTDVALPQCEQGIEAGYRSRAPPVFST